MNVVQSPLDAAALLKLPMDGDPRTDPGLALQEATRLMAEVSAQSDLMLRAASRQGATIAETHQARLQDTLQRLAGAAGALSHAWSAQAGGGALAAAWSEYLRDRAERFALTADALRERGEIFVAHEEAGCPPVLIYDYEIAMDGAALPRPCNYQLLAITPPPGVALDPTKRPYVIIDPRAGHGAGIGGFKADSQVGVALKQGHPTYFVSFRRDPEPGQTLADVTRAEAEFVREVQRRHPQAPKPVVIGNCQGGWATLLLAATNPDITGPIVLNGAPVQPWAGEVGTNVMRYNAGVMAGAWAPMFLSDLGGGVFDGAHLVENFEKLNPSRSYFTKYYDLFSKIDSERGRFLEFERWWGGFFRLNESEIRWIVEQIFVGNRLVRGMAQLEPGRTVDVKNVRSPIIVFASHGDNITPPQQALGWIVGSYADEQEIRIRGQRIVYMMHEEVGHLGIFVSAKIAQKEHTQMASVMETIEALPPGLFEMRIESATGEGQARSFTVSFAERRFDDLRKICGEGRDENAFAAVARASELQAELYATFMRPMVRAMVTPAAAELARRMHPLRVQRGMAAAPGPMGAMMKMMASAVARDRQPAAQDNPFVAAESAAAELLEQTIDVARDLRDMLYEQTFFALWGGPLARAYGASHAHGRTRKLSAELKGLPEVVSAVQRIEEGGFVEAVIRMLVLLADSRGDVRRDRLERSAGLMAGDGPFAQLSPERRALVIREQSLIATFERERAFETLPKLLPDPEDRALAMRVARYVPGRIDEMAPATLDALRRMAAILEQPPFTDDVIENPLRPALLTGDGA
ncbi:alpha/beta fold hydrolase [Rubrimonas cliftonensis]|uniref:Alpha/beta hydrolase n=1 Tax=Rubrimonas cliftonensis TaxID=89524 RepID=A0A1H4G2A6_9RHOB|nr:alpha/beta fold hydrolase [Rubrimonas cliftonensis]SEB03431.1 Protein of unknown function [Rubrimonas cliftonensis]